MARNSRAQVETLALWHCPTCGYVNAAKNHCAGCHKRPPRAVKANTKAMLENREGRSPRQ